MRYSIVFPALAAASTVSAGSIVARQAVDDCTILNYALTLEHLEDTFYRTGIANFTAGLQSFAPAPFYANLQTVASDEKTHVDVLTSVITAKCACAVKEAKYAFGVTDAKSFVTLASVLEGVGVSAYLGAATDIMSKDYLTAAGAIFGVEARHASYLRAAIAERPFPAPFETPLKYNSVFSLAAQFITGFDPTDKCSGTLPFKALPPLALQCSQYYYEAGRSSVTFTGAADKYSSKGTIYAVFWSGLDKAFVPTRVTGKDLKIGSGSASTPGNDMPIPDGYTGQVYVALTTSNDPTVGATDQYLLTSPAILEVWPKGGAPSTPKGPCP